MDSTKINIAIDERTTNDILSFCTANSIDDVDKFCTACFLKGYNIVKYGMSPMDNVKKETMPVSIVDEDSVVTHKGKKVKIIKKKL